MEKNDNLAVDANELEKSLNPENIASSQQPSKPMTVRLLAISGSLRTSSVNTALLRAAIALAPENVVVTLYGGLGELPHFNPDLDGDVAPPPVADFRRRLAEADGILICCPEYAHGVPGVMKNALDWIVGSGEFINKPVALISARPASWAQASLTETLAVMMAKLVAEASITLPPTTNCMTEAALAANPEIAFMLQSALVAFARAVRGFQAGGTE
jgi:NAD(P)H-dependent FMN reductase